MVTIFRAKKFFRFCQVAYKRWTSFAFKLNGISRYFLVDCGEKCFMLEKDEFLNGIRNYNSSR